MNLRAIILCTLLFAYSAISQGIPRFLWTPVVRPFDWRPAYGNNAFNPDKNGSTDTTGANGTNLDQNSTVKWNSLTSLIEFNSTQTVTIGSEANKRVTRWNGNSTQNSTNPNLRLITPTDTNNTALKIQYFSAPQRRMIDDRNSSESYLIYSSNPLVSPTVRTTYKGYTITAANLVGPRNVTTHAQSGNWTQRDYWYEFTMTSDGRVGLEGTKTFTVAGVPTAAFVNEQRLLGNTVELEPPLSSSFAGFFGGASYNTMANLCIDPADITVGEMFRFTRAVSGSAPNWVVNPLIPPATRPAIVGDNTSSLPRYQRQNMYSTTRFFGNFFISPGVVANNQSNTGNSGTFGANDPITTLSSTRSINAIMQMGDLTRKLRILNRLPHLGPDYLFINVVTPNITVGPNTLPNITQ